MNFLYCKDFIRGGMDDWCVVNFFEVDFEMDFFIDCGEFGWFLVGV